MNILKLTTYAKEYAFQLCLIGTILSIGYVISDNSQSLRKVSTLESGIQTCFSRVNQTYTAKIIKDSTSVYLSQNFQALTEECMAEALSSAEESALKIDGGFFKKLSTLASSVHWFHEDLISGSNTGDTSSNPKIKTLTSSDRFEKIEVLKDELFETTDSLKNKINGTIENLKLAYNVLLALLSLAIFVELVKQTKRKYGNYQGEHDAETELLGSTQLNVAKSIDIIKSTLERNQLAYSSRLLGKLADHLTVERSREFSRLKPTPSIAQALEETGYSTSAQNDERIDALWNDDERVFDADGITGVGELVDHTFSLAQRRNEDRNSKNATAVRGVANLENAVEKIFDLVSDRIFKNGIAIELNMGQSLGIQFRTEELEQVLFQALSNAITSLEEKTELTGRKLTINGLRLGSSVVMDIVTAGVAVNTKQADKSIDSITIGLTICESFMEEFGGKIQYDINKNIKGQTTGEIIKLVFKGADKVQNSARLVDVKFGTKQEILDLISVQ